MINYFKKTYSNLEPKTIKILKNGWKFCTILCIISLIILLSYNILIKDPFIYKVGILIFKLSITFAIEFLICAYSIDLIKKSFN